MRKYRFGRNKQSQLNEHSFAGAVSRTAMIFVDSGNVQLSRGMSSCTGFFYTDKLAFWIAPCLQAGGNKSAGLRVSGIRRSVTWGI